MNHKIMLRLFTVMVLLLVSLPTQRAAKANTYTVLYTADFGPGSLREAITLANANPGLDTIEFDIAGCSGACVIKPGNMNPLPTLTDEEGLIIDGTSQTDNRGDSNPSGPEIEIDGDNLTLTSAYDNGINIASSNNVIMGLIINNFPLNGIAIAKDADTDVVMNNTIIDNCIGTTSNCYNDDGNGLNGIYIGNGAMNNTIGGDSEGTRNIIKWNGWNGVELHGSGTENNLVIGNLILNNEYHGIRIYGGAKHNTIGGDTYLRMNSIQLNNQDGIRIQGSGTNDNAIKANVIGGFESANRGNGVQITLGAQGNTIGCSAYQSYIGQNFKSGVYITGTETISNTVLNSRIGDNTAGSSDFGVLIGGGAHANTIGPENVIYNNHKDGVRIQGSGTEDNVVTGNTIGLNLDGSADFGNYENGILITQGASNNVIGGDSIDELNIIAGNLMSGVVISGTNTNNNTVIGNFIGTDLDDTPDLGNQGYGIYLFNGAQHNLIGGDSSAERNLISGNENHGVAIIGRETMTNTISGNYIGTNASGEQALQNEGYGVYVMAPQNIIGGYEAWEGNLISGNNLSGVMLYAFGTGTDNVVIGNKIGTDKDGGAAIANGVHGIYIAFGASDNLIGGEAPGARNLISGNTISGVMLIGEGTQGNIIAGNFIGTDLNAANALPNGFQGVHIYDAHDNIIGGDSESDRNIISGNTGVGVHIELDNAINNTVSGNYIGTASDGSTALSNGGAGIKINYGAHQNTIGGGTENERNLISGNLSNGVVISGTDTTSNTVAGNYIGVDYLGEAPLGNGEHGVLIGGGAQGNIIGGEFGTTGNLISGNAMDGVHLTGSGTFSNTILGNYIGTDMTGVHPIGNQEHGIIISGGAQTNTIGSGNLIANNRLDGLLVSGVDAVGNVITQNSIHTNQMGIHLEFGGNSFIEPPAIISASMDGLVGGTVCAGCVVELFWNSTPDGEGETYLGRATAASEGTFALYIALPNDHNLTATATDARGTSEFSQVYNPTWFLYLPVASFED